MADQVFPPGPVKGFQHQSPVLGVLPLEQRPLHGLFVGIFGPYTGSMVRGSSPVWYMAVESVPGVG